ncbi:prepilin-type N-terminal cleavage/methylation domain-containing protein [Aneurinibacillus terranovensis]|uniref:prepilin-type N-terminal cleavage/methylation domain-containing protein n=1 Tax=Aneurinibacillus terranovensis TaxID=278991 RepID=UPI000417F7FF|nr:prepilin-type N-terminal cleavage/methylation domain-containing protein [Aneurinibacillus terranovensis]
MFNWKKIVKDQRGLTLIELLATIVILGIIAAIAIPAIGGLITNSKKDATAANAIQMVNSAKLYITSHTDKFTAATTYIPLNVLYTDKQLETMKDPFNSNSDYYKDSSTDVTTTAPTASSYVEVDNSSGNYTYKVYLSKDGTKNYFEATAGATGNTSPVPVDNLKRDFVDAN